ncbi:MAG: hypothetical protein D6689_18915 [Deltaproteobacteria bacterium]|nr:MAG: hypothetical protein D6689_18915 [Deltaproteobacteria bacterium]
MLEGDLTERESLRDLHVDTPRVVLNLARVRYINSEGSRRLLQFLDELPATDVVAELAPPAVVDLLNLVPALASKLSVTSVIVPVECPNCLTEGDVRARVTPGRVPEVDLPTCDECGARMEMAVLPDRYFAFLTA